MLLLLSLLSLLFCNELKKINGTFKIKKKHVLTVLLSSLVLNHDNTKYKVEFKGCNKMLIGQNKQY